MKKLRWIIIVLIIALAAACERRPLEYTYGPTIKTIVKVLWEVNVHTYPDGKKPTGITLFFFRDGKFYNSFTTANVDSCTVELPVGQYRLYMISQSPEEYWKVDFKNMRSFNGAESILKQSSSKWALRSGLEDEAVVENPEIIYAGTSEEFEVTQAMIDDYQYYSTTLHRKLASKGSLQDKQIKDLEQAVYYYTIRIPVYPYNIVSQLQFIIYAANIDVLQAVRASNSGMARTFVLTQSTTGKEEAIQMITNEWERTTDDASKRIGHITGTITTFGLPNGEIPSASRDSSLNVSALLIDNATIANYTFNVGDKIQNLDPNPGYRALYRVVFGSVDNPAITLPDVKPHGGGGFIASVHDWEEEIESDIVI